MHLKDPWDHLKRVGDLPGPGLPVLTEVVITGPQWCPTTVICIILNEQMQKKNATSNLRISAKIGRIGRTALQNQGSFPALRICKDLQCT
jgi:hypothetical protein